MTNIDNCPVTVECITIKCKKDLPMLRDVYDAKELATAANTVQNPNTTTTLLVHHTFEGWLSQAFAAQGSISSGSWGYLNQLNPNQTNVPDNSSATLTPGFRLTDCKMFNEFFKVVRSKTRVIQPGEAVKFTKFSKKARWVKEANWCDAIDLNAFGATLANLKGGIATKFQAKKGFCYYIWRIQSIPVSSNAGATNSVTFGKSYLDIIVTYRYSVSAVTHHQEMTFNYPVLPTSITEKVIFPGTSTATAEAPAT